MDGRIDPHHIAGIDQEIARLRDEGLIRLEVHDGEEIMIITELGKQRLTELNEDES